MTRLGTLAAACGALLALPSVAQAQLSFQWDRLWDGDGGEEDYVNDLTVDPGTGNVVVTGDSWGTLPTLPYSDHYCLGVTVAYGPDGTPLWEASRGQAADQSYHFAEAIEVDGAAGLVLVAGDYYDSATTPSISGEAWVAAYDIASGAELWSVTFPGTRDFLSLAHDPGGSRTFVATRSYAPTLGWQTTVHGVDSGGAVAWSTLVEIDPATVNHEWLRALAWDASSQRLYGGGGGAGRNPGGAFLFALDSAGVEQWFHVFNAVGSSNYAVWDIAVDGAGDRVFFGGRAFTGSGGQDWMILARDGSTGAALWHRIIDGSAGVTDQLQAIVWEPLAGRVLAAGRTDGFAQATLTALDADAGGATLWSQGMADGEWRAAEAGPDGTVTVGGNIGASSERRIRVAAYDAAGTLVGDAAYYSPALSPGSDSLWAMGLGSAGEVYAGGVVDETAGSSERQFVTVKFADGQTAGGLADLVDNLEESGVLTGQGLSATLTQAEGMIEQGNDNAASALLGAFINSIQRDINSGALDPALGQELLDAAQVLLAGIAP